MLLNLNEFHLIQTRLLLFSIPHLDKSSSDFECHLIWLIHSQSFHSERQFPITYRLTVPCTFQHRLVKNLELVVLHDQGLSEFHLDQIRKYPLYSNLNRPSFHKFQEPFQIHYTETLPTLSTFHYSVADSHHTQQSKVDTGQLHYSRCNARLIDYYIPQLPYHSMIQQFAKRLIQFRWFPM